MKREQADKPKPWRAPTRRMFVAMLGAAAAAIAVREREPDPVEPPRHPRTGKTLWIGHC